MNVTELARRMRMNTHTLLEILPEFGFDIGKKAIKVDDRVAQKIMRQSRRIKESLEKRKKVEADKQKQLEKEMRQERGESVSIPDVITVRDFADRLGLPVTAVITELMKNGILANLNQNIDRDTATVLAEDLGFTVATDEGEDESGESTEVVDALETALESQNKDKMQSRPPVVVVMGHVDHGKTRLLDSVRETNVIDTESGGITQHIGAYQVSKQDQLMTFIDTPGHEAFTVMRSRGARIADIAILVVAADDGVMPQTVEAINIIQAAKLPMIVAINKIDKPEANVEKVKTELSQRNIVPEEWGGKVPMVSISAKDGTNIPDLLDTILLVAEMETENIKAVPGRAAVGTVIESHVDKGEGPVATILVQAGTLNRGDALVVNNQIYGTVRAMRDYTGADVSAAEPSTPVKILGFKSAPQVGDILDVSQRKSATKVKKTRGSGAKPPVTQQAAAAENEDDGKKKVLNIVIRADVLGSLEAITNSIEKFQHEEVAVKVVSKGLGNITETDVDKAQGSGAQIFAFHVQVPATAKELAGTKEVKVKKFEVIYALLEYIEDELQKLLPSEKIVTEHGTAQVLAIFRTDKSGMTVGCKITSGKFVKGAKIRVTRGEYQEGIGVAESLQIGTSKESEVHEGTEFGMRFDGKTKVHVDDILEAYTEEIKERKIAFKHLADK